MKKRDVLVIGDPHAHPKHDSARFAALGRYIAETRPDVVLCTGDFADMPSLSAYDKGKKAFEGRRYRADVDASLEALEALHAPLKGLRSKPAFVMTRGNHEDRIDRAANDHPELDGVISTSDLGFRERGWDVAAFKESVDVAGFRASHYFPSGIAGRPIGGMNQASTMARLLMQSAIVGHSHVKDISERSRPDGSKVVCLSAGCYSHPKHVEGWNRDTDAMWWRGVVLLEGAAGGQYEAISWITQRRLMETFG